MTRKPHGQLRQSLRDAFAGVALAYKREPNIRREIGIAFVVCVVAFLAQFGRGSWAVLVLIIVFVLALEFVNSVVEHLLDVVKPRLLPQVKAIKDMMAGGVLVASLGALVIGGLLFAPFFIELIGRL